jgi:hypothetical protein
MTTPRDPDRLIRSFLAEGQTDLPDRSYDAVRSEIERTRQRVVIGPWRLPDMNTYLKYGVAAAAVVVVAIVGINLMAPSGGVGGPVATASPAPTLAPTAAPTTASTPGSTGLALFPPEGPISAGTHTAVLEGFTVSFTVPADGWSVTPGQFIGTESFGQATDVSFNLWPSSPDNLYSDPCRHTPLDPPPSHTAAGLIAAAAAIPGTDLVSGPSSLTIGGHPAQHVAFTIPDDLSCDPEQFWVWYDNSGGGQDWRWAGVLGEMHQVWTIDVDGKVIWINASTWAGSSPEVDQAVQAFIDSIQIE